MENDDDEDVIFENSPLHAHLKDLGFSDDEIGLTSKNTMAETVQDAQLLHQFTVGMNAVISYLTLKASLWTKGQKNNNYPEKTYVKLLFSSKLLVDDDKILLENLLENSDEYICQVTLSESQPFVYSCSWMGFVGMVLLAVIFHQFLYGYFSYLILLVLYFTISIMVLLLWKIRRKESSHSQILARYIKETENLLLNLKRSIRIIQELELITRGFTLISADTPVSRLEKVINGNRSRQCPELRKTVFLMARECMMIHRIHTKTLIDLVPLLPDVDNVSHYISVIPLDDYGQCMNPTSQDELTKITDNFSLPSIKAMYQLSLVQCSEFARRLTMCFLSEVHLKSTPLSESSLATISNEIHKIYDKTATVGESMKRSYDFHRFSILEPVTREIASSNTEIQPLAAIKTATHSLELHMLATLNRVRDFDKYVTENKFDEDAMISEYTRIKSELDSGMNCWDEGLVRVQKYFQPESNIKSPISNNETSSFASSDNQQQQTPVHKIDNSDPVIEDEMFEVITDNKHVVDSPVGGDWMDDSSELKMAKKKERSEAARVLKELKCVISVRATELLEREEKALEAWKKRVGQTVDSAKGSMDDRNDLIKTIKDSEKIINNECAEYVINDDEDSDENLQKRINYKYKPTNFDLSDNDDDLDTEEVYTDCGKNCNDVDVPDSNVIKCLNERLGIGCNGGTSFAFTSSVAAMAAARSQGLTQDTFGDSSDDENDVA